MPWKGEKDPYKIWLSEIILQQTRVEQGLNYYHRFVRAFPDVHKLAKAPDPSVFKLWEGLGYYTRCRNLIATARYISKEHRGEFPGTYEEIRTLKGIGPYTAAAISSFAFDLPHAVVDGNVFRVLARIFGISIPADSTEGKKYFTALANDLLDKKHPGLYNQAIMDFGAVICKPAPLCNICVFNRSCHAFLNSKVNVLPVKKKKIVIRQRWFYYLVLEYKDQTAIRHRAGKDIWQDLYEFPMIEMEKETDPGKILEQAGKKGWLKKDDAVISVSDLYKQQLTHQLITGRFIKIKMKQRPGKGKDSPPPGLVWIAKNTISKFAFPRFINQYLLKENL